MGRNVDLFAAMIKEAHRPRWADALASQGWRKSWLDYVRGQNAAKLCLRFLVLTAARSSEARGASWDEIDFNGVAWTISASRMKAGVEHRAPPELSGRRSVEARGS